MTVWVIENMADPCSKRPKTARSTPVVTNAAKQGGLNLKSASFQAATSAMHKLVSKHLELIVEARFPSISRSNRAPAQPFLTAVGTRFFPFVAQSVSRNTLTFTGKGFVVQPSVIREDVLVALVGGMCSFGNIRLGRVSVTVNPGCFVAKNPHSSNGIKKRPISVVVESVEVG